MANREARGLLHNQAVHVRDAQICRELAIVNVRRSHACLSAAFLIMLLLSLLLYKVQYQLGIEILPFVPIDDSGFQVYNEKLLRRVETSRGAQQQKNKGFLFCWIMTVGFSHRTRVTAINDTWFPRCDASAVFSNTLKGLDASVPVHNVFKFLPDSYFKLFWKTRLALYYIYRNVSREFDWYFKADDDTYVIVETLKQYLRQFDPNLPHYIGYRLKRRMPKHGYNSGGTGYVLSRAAMAAFADSLFHNHTACPYHEWEDYGIGRCLGNLGIFAQDTRDEQGRQRFLPWRPEQHFTADLTARFIFDPIQHKGFDIFHENLISMHHLRPDEIRLVDGMLYRIARLRSAAANNSIIVS